MRKDRVRVGLVGTGRAGMVHAKNYQFNIPEACVTAVVDTDEGKGRTAAAELKIEGQYYSDLEKVLQEDIVDAICIGAPTFVHAEIAVAAARAGKHVFCEKPMATTLVQADEMIAAVQESGVKFQLGFMRRFDPGFVRAKKMIEDGVIGDVILIKSTGRGPGLPGSWYFPVDQSNGLLAEVNTHDIDTLFWLAQSDVSRIYAEAGNFKCQDIAKDYPGFYDNVVATLRFVDGKMGVIDGACPATYGYDARIEVLGTKGVIFAGQLNEEAVISCTREGGVTTPVSHSWITKFKDAYVAEDKSFINCILEDKEPDVGYEAGRKALEVVLAGNRSIEEGVPVTLPLGVRKERE